jgi:3'5'-cyclic nucleotide phosphodiesterase
LEFNVFSYSKLADGHDLACMAQFLFQRKDFFELLDIDNDVFQEFIMKIQAGYLPNPYHTQTHAADVLQTVNYLMVKGEIIERCNLSNLETMAMYLSAAIHDYEHP